MSGVHSFIATDASVGATAGTFDDINTVGDPQILNDDASAYMGFVFSGAPVATVTGEAQSGRVRITSVSLDIVGEIFTYGAAEGAGIATNDQGTFFPAEFIPMTVKATGAERISSAFTTFTPTVTTAWSVAIGQVHADKDGFPAEFLPYWAAGVNPPARGGDANGASVSATTRTSLGTTTIEGKFKEAIALRPSVVQDPVGTAGEEVVGYLDIVSAISGVAPLQFPHPSIGPTLGTPVGGPIQHTPIRTLPFYVKRTEGIDRTFEAFEVLSTALTAVNGFSYNLIWR